MGLKDRRHPVAVIRAQILERLRGRVGLTSDLSASGNYPSVLCDLAEYAHPEFSLRESDVRWRPRSRGLGRPSSEVPSSMCDLLHLTDRCAILYWYKYYYYFN